MNKQKNNSVLVTVASGKKVNVPKSEVIDLSDGRKVKITKVSPFFKLLHHRYVLNEENAKIAKKEYNILIPTLPPEAHSSWRKDFWMIIDTYQEGALESVMVADWGDEKRFVNIYRDEEIGKVEKHITVRIYFSLLFWSRLFIADNYEESLPIITNYRECPFCSKPDCIIQIGSSIPSFCDDALVAYENRYSMSYCVCKKYRKGFIAVLLNKKKIDKDVVVCSFCGSHNTVSKEYKGLTKQLDLYRDELVADAEKKVDRKEPEDRLSKAVREYEDLLLKNPDLYDYMYECKQCFSVFDKKGRFLLRPGESEDW